VKTAARAYREPGCPRCWEPLPRIVLQRGVVYCGNCALEFQAALFDPPEPPRAAARALDGGTTAQCARHARNAAVGACERCGAFICALCKVESDGKVLCAACFDRLRAEGVLESARTTFRSWRTLGLYLSVGGLFLWPLGVVIGPTALVAAVRGISQDRKNGDEGGLPGSLLSLLLGVVVTLMGILMPLSMLEALRR